SNGSLASSELKAFHIDIIAVADMPQLTVTDTSTIEDIPVEVIFTSSLTDLDGSESLNVNVSDFQPTGIAVTEITELNGTYSFMVTPALNDHSEIVITVTSETIESDNGDTESVSENIHIDVEAVPDLPILIVENLTMIEDEISLVNFQSGLTDVDGSEILNLSLAGYPEGTVISGFPENTRITDYSFEIQTPENFNGVFEMFITAQAIEQSNSQFTSLVDTIFTSVLAADDPPALGDIPDQTVDGCSQFDSFNWIDLLTEVDGDYVEFSYSGNTELIINVDDTGNVSVSVPQTYWTGTETISFTVTDETDFGLSETLDVVYTINPLQTYYYDLDSDGLGAGDGLEFCPNQAPEDWVSNNDDLQPECPTNDEDICGYCGGENFEDEFGFVTGPNADCLGVCDGTALIDDCGICDGDNSSCNQPVAYDQDIEKMENTSIQISLIASDPNEDELSANIINYVSHGQLILTENPLIFDYQPEPGYFGADQFTFTVTDNEWTSDDATVNITVIEVNDPPMGTSYTINLNEDSFSGFDLIGVDEDSPDETLIFTIIQFPLHGMISEGRAVESYTYYPEQNFNGFDELVYEVSDGDTTSQSAVITFNVAAVNDIPIIQGVNYSTGTNEIEENSSVQISINITDAENDETEILLVSDPNHGELSDFDGSSIMTYFPESGYTGTDQFIIRAREVNTEQHLMSSQFTVNLIIINVNDAPVAFPVSTTVSEDEIDAVIDLSADDPDDDDLTYSISTPAQHGSAQIEGGFLIYTPDLNYNGPDTLEYLAYDGEYYSSPAHVSIMVIPVNDPPQVSDIEFFDVSDGFTFELFPEDVDGDDTYIEFIPQTDEGAGLTLFGAIIERLPDGTFVYHIGFIPTETDFIFYFANDEQSSSDLGVITFNIPDGTFTVSRNVPIATNQIVNLNEDVTTEISLIGADIDNLMDETASIQITQYPQNGNITDPVVDSITADYVTWLTQYTPDLNYYGTD
ncbi:MAG: tandem-95 repeat protein, partial [Fidelibacterota bacterium]